MGSLTVLQQIGGAILGGALAAPYHVCTTSSGLLRSTTCLLIHRPLLHTICTWAVPPGYQDRSLRARRFRPRQRQVAGANARRAYLNSRVETDAPYSRFSSPRGRAALGLAAVTAGSVADPPPSEASHFGVPQARLRPVGLPSALNPTGRCLEPATLGCTDRHLVVADVFRPRPLPRLIPTRIRGWRGGCRLAR